MVDYEHRDIERRPPPRAELPDALNLIPAFAWYCNASGGLTFLNERGSDYLGLPKDHPLRHGIDTGAEWDAYIPLLHPDDHEEARRAWSNCLSISRAGQVSFRVRNAQGGYRWHLSRAEPVRANNGTLLYWIGVNLDIENRIQAELYLAEGQRLAHMGSWAFNAGGFDYWSSELFRIHGLDPSGHAPTLDEYVALVHPEDREFVAETIRKMLTEHRGFDFTKRIVRPDGEIRRVRCVGGPATPDGAIPQFIGTGMDVTEHVLLTQELGRREAYLAEAQRLSHTGSFGWQPDTGEIIWSDETYRIFEYDSALKPTIDSMAQRVHPEDRADFLTVIEGAAAGVTHFEHTYRLLLPQGRVKHVHALAHVVHDVSGTREFVGAVTDITERKTAEEAFRSSEAYLAEAQRMSHTGSWANAANGEPKYWSEETYRVLGFDPAEPLPSLETIFRRIHPDDRAPMREQLERAIRDKTDFEVDMRFVHPITGIRNIRSTAHAVLDRYGDLREMVGTVIDITERKTAENKIRRLVDANILGIFIWNLEGPIIEANEAFLRMLQYGRDDLVSGRVRWTDLTPAEWRERDERAVTELNGTGTVQPYEKEFFRRDGNRVPVLVGAALFRGGGKEGVAFVLDLSERKRAEGALRRSESYLAEAQRMSKTGSWAWSPEHDITYWSEQCFRVLSFDPQGGLPQQEEFFRRIHPDDQPGFAEVTQTSIREKTPFETDYRVMHPDGSVRDVHVVAHPVLSASGDLIEFVGTVIDVTERKAAEEKIREQEMEFRQMLDLSSQHVAVFGPGGERLYANRAALDYVGLTLEEWQQTPGSFFRPGSFIHPDDRERVARDAANNRSGDTAYELELRVQGADGKYRWFLLRYDPLHDDKGRVKRWYLSSTDIDERKRAEEKLQLENVALREEIDKASMFEEVVGTSKPLKAVLSRIAKVAPTGSTVLITGETGTGKELVARAVHKRSQRSGRPFVSVNCAALAPTLVSSELFGHEKGAFTGATQRRLGRFEMAEGGTIFLDEVGELLPDTQAALLRVLQEREFDRVGGGQPVRVDVRVIAATNRDLNAAVANGTFREDLLYRLNVFPIEVPPLRERKDDILMLVEYFVQRYANRAGRNIRSIDQKTLDLLQCYEWPGNIRELQNVIERSIILSSTEVFSVDELWLSRRTSLQAPQVEPPSALDVEPRSEREIIEVALAETRGRVSGPSGAAAKLRIPPSTLETRIKALKINKQQFKFG